MHPSAIEATAIRNDFAELQAENARLHADKQDLAERNGELLKMQDRLAFALRLCMDWIEERLQDSESAGLRGIGARATAGAALRLLEPVRLPPAPEPAQLPLADGRMTVQ